jgi:hypothetical protein
MLLRPGDAGSNTFADHKEVLAAAIRQVPVRFRRRILNHRHVLGEPDQQVPELAPVEEIG